MRRTWKKIATFINFNILSITAYLIYMNLSLPNQYLSVSDDNITLNGKEYITINMKNKNIKSKEIPTSVFHPIEETSPETLTEKYAYKYDSTHEAIIKAYDILPIKQVDIKKIDPIEVYPCGQPFGIKMFTKGVMVVGMGEVEKGIIPSKDAGIKLGDMILSIDNIPVYNNEDIGDIINKASGNDVLVKVMRNNIEHIFKLTPRKSEIQDAYKAGMWVRNSTAGIGTLTFYTDDGYFGGLGHPVCDIDTGEIMPLLSGEIINVKISGITKGKSGYPGELKGSFSDENDIGLLIKNNATGVYGKITDIGSFSRQKKIPVAMIQEIKEGPAKILATINDSDPEYFDVVIDKINYNHINPCKNMVIKITDKKLMNKTGGIVQGMSGSPIIQNGKIVGAVTHVFVNQPNKGYGIFAQNMIKNIKYIS